MNLKVLIIEEITQHRPSVFESYAGFCTILGYEHRMFHELEEAFAAQKVFRPHIIVWIMHTNKNWHYIDLFRLQNKNLIVVTASDIKDFLQHASIPSSIHYHFPSSLVSLWEFQDMIAKFWGKQDNFIPPPASSAGD